MTRAYSFQAWKNEKNLGSICEQLLDNANMDMDVSSCPLSFTLTFFVTGSDIKVIFRCSEIESFELKKESTDEALFVVLEAHVCQKVSKDSGKKIWVISILPAAHINIECTKFEWSVEQITESEKQM